MNDTDTDTDTDTDQDLMLCCPACSQTFGVRVMNPMPPVLHVVCGTCGHGLTTDEILNAMATSLNELLEKARDRLAGTLPGKP